MADGKKIRKTVLGLISAVLGTALLALLAASLILAKPQEEKSETATARPFENASPAVSIQSESDLVSLISAFPAPVMSFMSGSGMTFVSATSSDVAYNGGFARIAVLYWQTSEGVPVTLRTVWPADALSLLEDGYHFMPYAGPALFGGTSVRMENDETVRLHTATDQALYVVLLPRALSGQVSSLCGSLQLYSATAD